jgi:hypothetical protein
VADLRNESEHLTNVTAYATALAMASMMRGKFENP